MKDKYFESRFKFNPTRDRVWKEICRFHKKFVSKDDSVVDLGAGYCDFINNIEAKNKTAIDISTETKNYVASGINFIQSSVTNLSALPDSSVDAVHASNLLEHFSDEDLEKIISEVRRILKDGGKLILMQPNFRLAYKRYFDDYTHKKVWSDVSLHDFLVAHDMKVILNMPRFLPFSMKSDSSFIPRFLIKWIVRLYINSPIKPFAGQMLIVSEK